MNEQSEQKNSFLFSIQTHRIDGRGYFASTYLLFQSCLINYRKMRLDD